MKLFGKRKNAKANRGKLVVIDGIPGSGRRTQIKLLADSLTFAGFTVALAEFPQSGNASAMLLEKYDGMDTHLSPQAEAVLYATNHMEAKEKLEDWLASGTIVLATNYAVANAARGGAKVEAGEQVKFFRWVTQLEHEIFAMPRPDLNIILHMPARLAEVNLVRNKKVKDADIDLATLTQQESAYVNLAGIYPQTKLVECAGGREPLAPKDIHNAVWQLVRRIALKNNLNS